MTDLYGALGVGSDATPEQIRKAYRKASKKAHPDAGGSSEQFAIIALAAEVLGDEQRRNTYDKTGRVEDKPQDKSMSAVMEAIDAVLNECARRGLDPASVDVIADARKTLQIKLEKMDEQARVAKDQIEKARKFVKRFKSKAGKKNRVGPMIEARVNQAEADAVKITADRPSIVTAMEILLEHAFDWTDDESGRQNTTMTVGRMMGMAFGP